MAFLPFVSDRLAALRRQRALAQSQVDWFDREIAAHEMATSFGTAITAPHVTTPDPIAPNPVPVAGNDYTPDPIATGQEVRRGCLLWAVAVAVVLGAALIAVFFFAYGDRPLFFMERNG